MTPQEQEVNDVKDRQFRVLAKIPKVAAVGMHAATTSIIQKLKVTKGNVLACDLKDVREARNRLDALRRARKNGYVTYKKAYRHGRTLYFRLR